MSWSESLYNTVVSVNSFLNGIVWGPIMLVFFVGIGIYFTVRTGFIQVTHAGDVWKNTIGSLFKKKTDAVNGVTPFQAVSTALAGTMGVGNIAGVAGAIVLGGAGAVFWMWISAIFGMVTKYSEILLAVKFRQTADDGTYYGGPMYYIEKGLNCKWLARLFAIFAAVAGIGIGNIAQSGEIVNAIKNIFKIDKIVIPEQAAQGFRNLFHLSSTGNMIIDYSLIIGIVLAVFTGFVIIGGIKRIASVTEKVVPFMAIFYIGGSLIILVMNFALIPSAFGQIFSQAFSLSAISGGVLGTVMMNAMKNGIARGVFSNEAGLGSAPIAHAASDNKSPVQQGFWGIFEVTCSLIVCTVTGLVVIMSGQVGAVDASGATVTGGALTSLAFDNFFNFGLDWLTGGLFISVAILFFALSTIIGWSYYGERCFNYLCNNNKKIVLIYKIVFVCFIVVGATTELSLVWDIADTLNGMMAIPNLIALALLSGTVIKATKEYFAKLKEAAQQEEKEPVTK